MWRCPLIFDEVDAAASLCDNNSFQASFGHVLYTVSLTASEHVGFMSE